jgi:hypothetical protein
MRKLIAYHAQATHELQQKEPWHVQVEEVYRCLAR